MLLVSRFLTPPIEGSLCINNSGTAFAAWVDNALPGKPIKVAVSIDPAANLIQALSKKRLIYQTGLYP